MFVVVFGVRQHSRKMDNIQWLAAWHRSVLHHSSCTLWLFLVPVQRLGERCNCFFQCPNWLPPCSAVSRAPSWLPLASSFTEQCHISAIHCANNTEYCWYTVLPCSCRYRTLLFPQRGCFHGRPMAIENGNAGTKFNFHQRPEVSSSYASTS